ncbi:melanotransferrin-like [Sceloporus undulatus]|uniref:melanotransferrin-like n=1 Tax=Sceloporus undulatus TaxID=8520 RepID=UPI001C4CD6F1|nr:melanotransferrin-like [Sceloporus undulatus]
MGLFQVVTTSFLPPFWHCFPTRCLLGDVRRRNYGDVAFVEHHGLLRNLERLSVPASDFELLCPNGSRAAILDWRECNLGRVPPGVVVTRPMSVAKVHGFLEKSQDAGANSDFHLFRSEKIWGR